MKKQVEAGKHLLANSIIQSSPKISRGEKYRGLPYVMLDYPRFFSKEDILAIRTFFWWGNFFSITLHVKGKFLAPISALIIINLKALLKKEFFISVSGDEWDHDLTGGDYRPLKTFNEQSLQ